MGYAGHVRGEGVGLIVSRDPRGVAILDTRVQQGQNGQQFVDGHVLPLTEARDLHAILATALAPGSATGVIGEIETIAGRTLYITRSAAAVTLTRDLAEHGEWTWRMRDQVEALHDELGKAIENDAPVSDEHGVREGDDEGNDEPALMAANAELPEPPVRRQRTTESHAPQ